MGRNFLEFDNMSSGLEKKVKQTLKFRTGKFVWRVKFNTPLDPASINGRTMYVTNTNQIPLRTSIRYDANENMIEIEPLDAYAKDEPYILHISKKVRSKGGKHLKEDLQIQFKL